MDKAEPRPDWTGTTCVIIAGGPSLTLGDVAYAAKSGAKCIAVNESWRLHLGADIVYGADFAWWNRRAPSRDLFTGERWSQASGWPQGEAKVFGTRLIASEPGEQWSTDPSLIYQGMNSAFQAGNLAYLFGARRIVYLGLDLQVGTRHHWHEFYRGQQVFDRVQNGIPGMIHAFETAAPQIVSLGVEVINASRETALTCFPRKAIEDAIPSRSV